MHTILTYTFRIFLWASLASLLMVGNIFATENASSKKESRITSQSWETQEINATDKNTTDTVKLKQDIDTSIVDFIVVPKAKQLIKDISIKFALEYPEPSERIQAYQTIKKRLVLRKNRIDVLKMSDKGKHILQEFLDQMIELLDKKMNELS